MQIEVSERIQIDSSSTVDDVKVGDKVLVNINDYAVVVTVTDVDDGLTPCNAFSAELDAASPAQLHKSKTFCFKSESFVGIVKEW
jgi:hypothetical protein